MSYMVLWHAADKPTLYEADDFASLEEAKAAIDGFAAKYPWNNYLLVHVEDDRRGTGKRPHPWGNGEITMMGVGQTAVQAKETK